MYLKIATLMCDIFWATLDKNFNRLEGSFKLKFQRVPHLCINLVLWEKKSNSGVTSFKNFHKSFPQTLNCKSFCN